MTGTKEQLTIKHKEFPDVLSATMLSEGNIDKVKEVRELENLQCDSCTAEFTKGLHIKLDKYIDEWVCELMLDIFLCTTCLAKGLGMYAYGKRVLTTVP